MENLIIVEKSWAVENVNEFKVKEKKKLNIELDTFTLILNCAHRW